LGVNQTLNPSKPDHRAPEKRRVLIKGGELLLWAKENDKGGSYLHFLLVKQKNGEKSPGGFLEEGGKRRIIWSREKAPIEKKSSLGDSMIPKRGETDHCLPPKSTRERNVISTEGKRDKGRGGHKEDWERPRAKDRGGLSCGADRRTRRLLNSFTRGETKRRVLGMPIHKRKKKE